MLKDGESKREMRLRDSLDKISVKRCEILQYICTKYQLRTYASPYTKVREEEKGESCGKIYGMEQFP